MAYGAYQSRNPVVSSNTLRSIPTFRPSAGFFGPSKADHLTGDVRRATDALDGWARMYAEARAKLGQANRKRPEVRRVHQARAMREMNAVRAGMRANFRALASARAGLLALGVTLAGCA